MREVNSKVKDDSAAAFRSHPRSMEFLAKDSVHCSFSRFFVRAGESASNSQAQ